MIKNTFTILDFVYFWRIFVEWVDLGVRASNYKKIHIYKNLKVHNY